MRPIDNILNTRLPKHSDAKSMVKFEIKNDKKYYCHMRRIENKEGGALA